MLDLSWNQIQSEGLQYLAQGLRHNTVRKVLFFLRHIYHCISIQTLTNLSLSLNKIDEEGAQHLAQALENNTVRKVFLFSIRYSTLCLHIGTHYSLS